MLVLYDETEEEFETLGIGVLTDFKELPTITEVLKGEYILEFEYLKKGKYAEFLNERNIIKAQNQPFRIENIKPSKDGYRILARHIVFDLRDNYVLDVSPSEKTAQEALNWVLSRTTFPTNFVATGDCTKLASARYVRLNASEVLWDADNSILNRFGAEPEYDKYRIILHNMRGSNTSIEIREKKNLIGFEMNIDLSTVKTRIQPVGNDGLTLPETFVDSPLINNYPTPKIGKLELDIGIDEETTEAQAYALMRQAVQEQYDLGLDKPTISLKVDFVELSKTEEYKNFQNLETINLGDRLRFFMPSINQNLQIRVIKIVKNALTGRIISLELGNEIPNIVTQQKVNNQVLQEKITTSALTQAKIDATKLINHPFNGHLFISEETGELYIADTDDLSTATYIWKWGLGGLGFSKTGINGTFETAWTQDGKFVADFITAGKLNTDVIEGYDNLTLTVRGNTDAIGDRTGKSTSITADLESIEQKITDATDTTTSASTETALIPTTDLKDITASYPIHLEVYPIGENISYLYPNPNLFPSNLTYLKVRTLRFRNTKTNENFDYVLPDDLLYYDSENYDKFIVDYAERTCQIIQKCEYNADGSVYVLQNPITKNYNFADEIEANLNLTAGDYEVSLLGYTTGYIFARLMTLNMYTDQFATKVELSSSIKLTKQSIESEVSAKYATLNTTNELSTRISQTVRSISLTVKDNGDNCGLTIRLKNEDGTELSSEQANITLNGLVKFNDLKNSGSTEINGANITTGKISAARLDASVITTSNFSAQTVNASKITTGTLDASKITVKNLSASSITTGTLDASKVTVNNLNASKITSGTINADNIKITNLNADNIKSGTLSVDRLDASVITTSNFSAQNINASNIKSGTFSSASIAIKGGTGFLKMLTGSTNHPYVSALNISKGTNGISFRSGTSIDNAGGEICSIEAGDSYLTISGNGADENRGVQLVARNGVIISSGTSGTYLLFDGSVISSNHGGSMYANYNCCITPASTSHYAYVRTTDSGNKIATSAVGPSSLNVKKNLMSLEDEYDSLYKDIQSIGTYNYDYKYKGVKDDLTKDYGFIIDEIESTKHLSKYFRSYDVKKWIDGDTLRSKARDEEDLSMFEELDVKEWDRDSYIKGMFIMIKTLQHKIDQLERRIS